MADVQAISGFFPATVREAYANQVDYCRANDAPVTARIVEAIGGLLYAADPGAFIADWLDRGAAVRPARPREYTVPAAR